MDTREKTGTQRPRGGATGRGVVFGGAAGVVMFALTGQVWWLGLAGVGLVIGAAIDASGRRP